MSYWLLYAFIVYGDGVSSFPINMYNKKMDCIEAKVDLTQKFKDNKHIKDYRLICQQRAYNFDYDGSKIYIKE